MYSIFIVEGSGQGYNDILNLRLNNNEIGTKKKQQGWKTEKQGSKFKKIKAGKEKKFTASRT
jgi:hypothetical protein